MAPPIPDYALLLETILRLSTIFIVLALIWVGAGRMGGSSLERYGTASLLSVTLLGWAILARMLGIQGVYLAAADRNAPWILAGVLAPLLIMAAGLRLWRSAGRLAAAVPLPWLVGAQIYRIGGAVFVLLWGGGYLPWQFALPAGLGDIATGLWAIGVAVLLIRQSPGAERAAYRWSLFGIADLVLALLLGGLTSPGRAQLLALSHPNRFVTAYPLVMIPTFAVPLALLLHGLVLARLRRRTRPSDRPVGGIRAAQVS